jgi:hypothetical protein
MKRIMLWALVVAIVLSFTASAVFAAAGGTTQNGNKPTRTIENVTLGQQAIRQEFVWDEASGTFQTVNLYTVGEVEDYIADMSNVLHRGAAGSGTLIGSPAAYTYWNGTQWVTLSDITRYDGVDERAEAVVSRYDKTFYTNSTSYYYAVTGYQTLYSYSIQTQVVRHDPYYYTYYHTYSYSTGQVAQTGTFSQITAVPSAFDPVVEVNLANGWNVTINSNYTMWGNEVRITSPTGATTYVYGDPHLLQAGGTQQQELAAIGSYVFDLGGYTLDLSCMQSNAGFSLVTDLAITGPNGYNMTYGRNNEVKVTGGTAK